MLFYELIYFQVTRKKERKEIILLPIFSGWSSSKYSSSWVNFLPLSEICGHCWRWGNILDRAIYWFSILFPLSYFKMFSVKNKTSETTRSISFFLVRRLDLSLWARVKHVRKSKEQSGEVTLTIPRKLGYNENILNIWKERAIWLQVREPVIYVLAEFVR